MHTALILAILVRTLTDLSFKKAMNNLNFDALDSVGKNILLAMKNPFLWLGFLFGISNFLIWTISLQFFDLSYAYPFLSISYITIILGGKVFFNEHLDTHKQIGIGFIFAGSLVLFLG